MSFDVSASLCKFFPLILFSTPVFAEEVILVTADRIKSESVKTSSDVRIVSEKDIQNSLAKTLPELLSRESDVTIASSGQHNSNTSLFLRGTDSSHTLVLIDGIIMNDPGNPNRQFDIGRLSLNNIEKIEILKGSQGLAYGSNAIGGVILITTKKARTEEAHGEHYYNYGSFNTANLGGNFQKKSGKLSSSFGVDLFRTEGFSAANEKVNSGAEKDGSQRVTLDLNNSFEISDELEAGLVVRYNNSYADLDKGGGPGADDPNDELSEEEIYSRVQMKKLWGNGDAETKLGFNHSSHRRQFEVNYDAANPQSSVSINKGKLKEVSLEHTHALGAVLTQNINMSFQHESDQTGHSNENLSGFLYHQLDLEKLIFNFGLRIDHNQIFNEHITYKTAAGYKTEDGLIKLSYSTGFRAPSINQLFTPVYGNSRLVPETSRSADLSYESRLSGTLKISTSLFYTKINDRFSYDPVTFYNTNRGSAEIAGLEQTMKKNWSSMVAQSFSTTLLKTRDLSRGEKLARRPDISARNTFEFLLQDKHKVDFDLAFTGQRLDVDNNGNTVRTNAFLLAHLAYRYMFNEKGELFVKVKNVMDKNYEEIYGFGTGGRALTAGARFSY